MFPQYSHPKLDCRSSIFREAVCCIKDGIYALHTLKSETKMSLPATSLAFKSLHTEGDTGDVPRMLRRSEVWLHSITLHIIPHPKGFPMVLPWIQAFGTRLSLLTATSLCKEAPTNFVHPNAFELCSDENKVEKAIFKAVCLKSTWKTYLAGSPFRFPFR